LCEPKIGPTTHWSQYDTCTMVEVEQLSTERIAHAFTNTLKWKMGGSVSRPLPGESPVDFMFRNNQGFYTEPYVSNMAGWSEQMRPQIEIPYPREGSFTEEDMQLAKRLVKEGWGDPTWPYDYMTKSYEVWKDMKKVWDQGPEKKQVVAYVARNKRPAIEKPPPYCSPEPSAPSVMKSKTLQNNSQVVKQDINVEVPRKNAMVWLRAGNVISLKPLKMSDMESICKSLPSPQDASKFVTVLQTHTKYAHFTGVDYRAVLLRTLEGDVTESMLIDECPTLSRDNDKTTFFWEDPENHDVFFKQLRAFLDKRIGKRQDLSFAANTKQKPRESASDFYIRFRKAWVEESKLPMNNEMKALFINTFLNNMQSKQAQLIRITTTNLFDMDIDGLGKRVRELDSSGGFTIKTETAMFTGQRSQGKVYDRKAEVKPHWTQQKGPAIVCYYCGQEGHRRRDCREWKVQLQRKPWAKPQQQRSKTPASMYPTTWNKKTE